METRATLKNPDVLARMRGRFHSKLKRLLPEGA